MFSCCLAWASNVSHKLPHVSKCVCGADCQIFDRGEFTGVTFKYIIQSTAAGATNSTVWNREISCLASRKIIIASMGVMENQSVQKGGSDEPRAPAPLAVVAAAAVGVLRDDGGGSGCCCCCCCACACMWCCWINADDVLISWW
jgi:hypothetical protein